MATRRHLRPAARPCIEHLAMYGAVLFRLLPYPSQTCYGFPMASLAEHCADCRRELDEDFRHVHEWLDALYRTLGTKHRSVRHHAGGVEQVRKMWGDRAARAAEIHIIKDCGVVPSEQDAQMVAMFGAKAGGYK